MELRSRLRALFAEHSPEMLSLFRRARRTAQNYLGSTRRPFEQIYRDNRWGTDESRSGSGSTRAATVALCGELPPLLERLGVRTLVDAPCGDFWIRHAKLNLERYTGVDAVADLVDENCRLYAAPGRTFQVLDLTKERPPQADLILCRDLLIHLSFRHARRVLANFKRSGTEYLLCSQSPDHSTNEDIITGSFRPLNLRCAPFNFPRPIVELDDRVDDSLSSTGRRTMALWRLAGLPIG